MSGGDSVYDMLAMEIEEKNNVMPDCIYQWGIGEYEVDLDEYYDSKYSLGDVINYLDKRYEIDGGLACLHIKGTPNGETELKYMLEQISPYELDLSGLKFNPQYSEPLDSYFYDISNYIAVMDLSSFGRNCIVSYDDFRKNVDYESLEEVIVNPNCIQLIEVLEKLNEENGANIKITMKYDYSNQPELDFGE